MAAVLTYESQAKKTEDWAPYLHECGQTRFPDHSQDTPHVGIDVCPPDINESDATFTVVYDPDEPRDAVHGRIRFGLSAIKGVGRSAIDAIITAREKKPFRTLHELCGSVPPQAVNRATLEALIKSGALDSLHGGEQRARMMAALDGALKHGQQAARDRAAGQGSLFGGGATEEETQRSDDGADTEVFPLPTTAAWSRLDMLGHEREVLGFHVSGHPIDEYASQVQPFVTAILSDLSLRKTGTPVIVAGLISKVRSITVQKGRSAGSRMAIVELQDRYSSIEGVVFSDAFSGYGELVQPNQVIVACGRIDERNGEKQLLLDRLYRPDEAAEYLTDHIELELHGDAGIALERRVQMAAGVIKQAGGAQTASGAHPAEIYLRIHRPDGAVRLRSRMRLIPHGKVLEELHTVLGGEDRIHLAGQSASSLVSQRSRRR